MHLTLVALLHYLRIQLQPNRCVVFLWVGGEALKRSWTTTQPTTDEFQQYYLKFPSTD